MTLVPASQGLFRRHARALVASLALLVAFAWILRAGALPLIPSGASLSRVNAWDVVGMGLLLLASTLLRLGRYQFLIAPLAPVPLKRIMSISCVALGLLTFLPFRLGEVARPAMLREKGKLSGWAVTGTVGAERIIDGIVFSVALLMGLSFAAPHEPLPDHIGDLPVPAALVPRAAQVAALGFGAAFALMAVFYWWRGLARRITERVLGIFSARFAVRVASTVERLSEGLRFLPDLRNTGPFLLATLVALVAQIWGIQLLARGVGLPALSFAESSVVLGVLGLGFALPNAPGFFGAFQLALYAGLAVYVAPERVVNEGAVFVFLFYVIYMAQVVLLSIWGILAEYQPPAGGSAVIGFEDAVSGASRSGEAMRKEREMTRRVP
ncbi:MAG TPA: lysylphosphatidylglycerol synthase domain-containing protein [Polyangiaceae bacterium]